MLFCPDFSILLVGIPPPKGQVAGSNPAGVAKDTDFIGIYVYTPACV